MASINQLVSRIKVRLSRRSSTEDATIISELVAAQERLEKKAHLPDFLKTTEDKDVTSGILDVTTLTKKLIRFNEDVDRAVYYVDDTLAEPEVFIKRYDDRQQLRDLFPGDLTTGGVPRGYTYSYPNIELRPRPTALVPIKIRIRFFRRDPTTPAVDTTTLWSDNAPDLLAGEAGLVMARFLRDADAIKFFSEMRDIGKADLFGTDVATSAVDQEYIMGDKD